MIDLIKHDQLKIIMDDLTNAWNGFNNLYNKGNPDNIQDFKFHIHALQNIISSLIVFEPDDYYETPED